jgi:HSP20 family protein
MLMRFEQFRELDRTHGDTSPGEAQVRQIPIDAYRHGNEFKIHLDVPGVDPDSIEVTVEHDVLSVRASRNWLPAEGDQLQVSERAQGVFERQLFLGQNLDPDRLVASYDNGVLTITLPMATHTRARRIQVLRVGDVPMEDIQDHGLMSLEVKGALTS